MDNAVSTISNTVLQQAHDIVDDRDTFISFIRGLSDEALYDAMKPLLFRFFRNRQNVQKYDEKFRQQHGVSRAWNRALSDPDFHERRKAYMREYNRKRRNTNKHTDSEES